MKKTILSLLCLVVMIAGASDVMAREFADIYTECGLGAIIAPNNPAVAAVTNVTWDLGSTAISSDASCPENCKGGQEETAALINDSYEHLETDLASGRGEYLQMLLLLVEPTEGEEAFVQDLRADFALLVAQDDYATMSRFQKAEALYNLVYGYQAS